MLLPVDAALPTVWRWPKPRPANVFCELPNKTLGSFKQSMLSDFPESPATGSLLGNELVQKSSSKLGSEVAKMPSAQTHPQAVTRDKLAAFAVARSWGTATLGVHQSPVAMNWEFEMARSVLKMQFQQMMICL